MYLVGGDGIQAAAEGVKLDQIQALAVLHIGCSAVESGVVHPLVGNDERTLSVSQVGDGILGKNRKTVGGDELRDTVVDLRIYMVGTAGQYDAVTLMLL